MDINNLFICMNVCDTAQFYWTGMKLYKYKFGETYKIKHNCIYFRDKFHGWVSNGFILENFISVKEYVRDLSEVDELFEDMLIAYSHSI